MTARIVILAAVAAGMPAAGAHASCIPSTEADYVRRADAVFVGRVLAVREEAGRARFRILRVRKGRLRKGASVHVVATPYPSSITIAWSPEVGERWRVYVDRRRGRWVTNDCMGTRRA